ncbi:MAG TPA: type II toxin-antitoxin system VapC family toxin [Gemmataceae bacterium]|jgi:predicted nucleic acid-binding protein|nr:type II toxin-antitoxin system VapC family toxin [Gemmataceae bacterium]
MIVVDASVIVKCYVPEDGSEKAIKLISGLDKLVAPELIQVEVAAAFCGKTRDGEVKMHPDDAAACCDKWRKHMEAEVIATVPNEKLLAVAERLALNLKHPLQDCIYLALAKIEKTVLVTADTKFITKAGKLHPELRSLYEFPGL